VRGKVVYIQRSREQVSLLTMPCPSPRTVAPPPCLQLYMKDSLKEDVKFFEGFFFFIVGLLVRMTQLLCVAVSLRTKTLRENMGQCKLEGQDFKRD
jgi:hypothetical protein